ncbi:MAG: L-2-amino-thiazoline-4-carboxylic acid hydrolase [Betaproteobacteria bacterium]|nr:L-2-amino-thiazoline-4-carboxylic acid hydrolase [Betaproteobacteria bacterium]
MKLKNSFSLQEGVGNDAIKRLEKDWHSMIFISHDFFHCWRKAVEEKYGTTEAAELAERFWELVGEGTGNSFLKRGRDAGSLEQIVGAMERASQVMGETARVVRDRQDVLLIHDACPWIGSFKSYGAPGRCQSGCDRWFQKSLKTITPDFVVVTESCLASGDASCTRRFSPRKRS